MDLIELLGIKTDLVTAERVVLHVTVDDRHRQPYGIVHGGLNAVLAETAASLGANANLAAGQVAAGVNITTQHLRPVSAGVIKVVAIPLHRGRRLQTWRVENQVEKGLSASSTVTLINQTLPKK